jgi:hypothetical protein
MSGGTTRHRRLGGHLVEVQRPNAWDDDDDEATRFYERRGPVTDPHRDAVEPRHAPPDIADDELTIMLPRLVAPRRPGPGPRPVVPRPSSFLRPEVTAERPREHVRRSAPIAVERRDPRPRLVELPAAAEITEVEPPQRVEARRALSRRPPPLPHAVAVPVRYEPHQPHFATPPLLAPTDHLAREFGRRQRRPAGVSLGFCLLVAGLAFLAARAWHSTPAAGTAVVATTPTDALVFVDGHELGGQTSPFKLADLDVATEHLIEVSKPGFISQTRRVRVEPGDVRVLPGIELAAAHAETGVTLGSIPGGAAIYLDDHKLPDVTPARLVSLAPGAHRIRLEQRDFLPWGTTVEVAAGQVLDLPIAQLRPQRAAMAGKSARSSVAKTTHSAYRRSWSSARPHKRERTAEPIQADEPSLPPSPPGADGTLRINSLPWAEVFVDERSIGTTPQLDIALAAGRHKVRLVNPDLGMVKGFTIEIRPGKTLTKLVQMVE